MNQYLIPANSKKSQLIFSVFRPIDLGIVLIGGLVTLIMMFAVPGDTIGALFIKFLPIGFSLMLVLPIPYYHNILVFLQEFYIYIVNQKKYIWRGWCASYGFDDENKNKKGL